MGPSKALRPAVEKERVSREDSRDGRASARKPPKWFVDQADFWMGKVHSGELSQGEVARRLDTSNANISRWLAWLQEHYQQVQAQAGWDQPSDAARALGDFRFFRQRYFVAPREPYAGQPYVTREFHLKWINAILETIPEKAGGRATSGRGGQLAILSPPRHGKTELLAHFVIWLIVNNPDIAILWISHSLAKAKEVGQLIRGELETNVKLAEEMLGPGESFKPDMRGFAWRDDEFEVATRTRVQKAPTFRALGRNTSLQSIDSDFIVTDDVEDTEEILTPEGRAKNVEWFTINVGSRKQPHTGWLCIGSRNHPHDLLDHLLKSDDWSTIVESAHDFDCQRPVLDEEAHQDCMLWPEMLPYWQLASFFRNGNEAKVRMRWLNDPVGDGMVIFTEGMLRECTDRSRVLGGEDMIPPGYQLLGSIDPSPGAYQVTTLWAWSRENPVRYLVDIHVGKGGMDAWDALVFEWLSRYQLREWVVESNSTQSDYINRRESKAARHEAGVFVHPHATTGQKKHSVGIGVASMVPLYASKQIVLPYGDYESQGKVDAFIREHVNYDPDRSQQQTRWRIDRVMSAWFANMFIDGKRGRTSQTEAVDEEAGWLSVTDGGLFASDPAAGWFD